LPISSFPTADIDMTIEADALTFAGVPMSNGRGRLTSSAGRFTLDVSEVSAATGRANGRASLQFSGGQLDADVRLKATRFALDPFVTRIVGVRVLTGTGDVDVDFKTRGRSVRQLASTLDGAGAIKVDRGALVGFDLRAAVLSFGSPQSFDPSRRTAFDTMSVTVSASEGVMRTVDPLALSGPEARVTSRGTLALVTRRLQQSVLLTLFPPPIHLPLRLQVGGTLETPSVGWDIFAGISQPGEFATPFSVGAAEQQMPEEARAVVTRALAADPGASRLSPNARAFLEQLLSSR
jgi:uncharacterized protein involved in outer membrane biogenesis